MQRTEPNSAMSHDPNAEDLPQATVVRTKRRRLSVVWIIPALAAVVALGIVIQRVVAEGPTISIVFAAGNGIEAGKTLLKYKDVNIGEVSAVELVDGNTKVKVTARIAKSAGGLIVDDTQFWVVAPHIGLAGVSGISTLLSGNYIGVQAGSSERHRRDFVGLDVAPRIVGQKGRRFVLHAPDLGSLGVGAPIYYRRLPVGEVESYRLASDGKSVEIGIFVSSPYDADVHPDTRFWNASGIDVSLGENGLDVRTASLLALLAGGLSFDTPDYADGKVTAAEGASFRLFADRTVAMKQPDAFARHYVLLFNESVRGLSVGAPVTLMGLPVGEVTEVGLAFDPKSLAVHPRVTISFYPERTIARFDLSQQSAVRSNTEQDAEKHVRLLRRLVEERGLRAQLQTASLLTGQRFVAFEFLPKSPRPHVDWNGDPLELPVAPGQLADMEAKLASILDKIDHMPIVAMGDRAASVLKTLDQTLHDADAAIQHVDADAIPEIKKALEDLHQLLDSANSTLVGRDAPGQQELREALQEVAHAARSLRGLADYLERHPEALIRGKVEEPK
jgi:paraquat-inducible protein B